MTLIDFGDFKLRFDPKEIRINIDGELIDIGARRIDESENDILIDKEKYLATLSRTKTLSCEGNTLRNTLRDVKEVLKTNPENKYT